MAKRVRYGNRPAPKKVAPKPPASPGGGPFPTSFGVPPSPPLEGDILEPTAGLDELPQASSGHLTDAELRRAEELQAEIAAQERAALAEQIRRRQRGRAGEQDLDDVNAPLRVRAAKEYAYVARDVRHIIITGGIMAAILAVLAILINGMGLITI